MFKKAVAILLMGCGVYGMLHAASFLGFLPGLAQKQNVSVPEVTPNRGHRDSSSPNDHNAPSGAAEGSAARFGTVSIDPFSESDLSSLTPSLSLAAEALGGGYGQIGSAAVGGGSDELPAEVAGRGSRLTGSGFRAPGSVGGSGGFGAESLNSSLAPGGGASGMGRSPITLSAHEPVPAVPDGGHMLLLLALALGGVVLARRQEP